MRFSFLKGIFFLFFLLVSGMFLGASDARAATTVWSGGGGDAFWSTSGNWTSGVPGAGDTAQFDGTCVSNCNPDINTGTTVGTIDMQSGYGGTITYSGGGTFAITTLTQAAGIFTAGSGTLNVSGTFTLSGGTFNGGGGLISMGTLTVSGGTFTQSGSVTVNGTLTVSGGTFDGSGSSSGVTVQRFILSSGTYKASSGTMTVGLTSSNDETIFTKSGGTFTAGTGTVRFSSTDNSTTTHTINISSDIVFNNATIDLNSSSTASMTLSVASGSSVSVVGTFTDEDGPVNGGVWNVSGNVSIRCESSASGDCAANGTTQLNFTGSADQLCTKTGTNASSAAEPDGNIFVNKSGGTLSLGANMSWNANGQSLILTSSNTGTFSQGAYTLAVINLTVSSGAYSQGSGNLTVSNTMIMGGWSPTTPAVYDTSGNQYSPVQVGTQYWLNKNLNVGARINGSADQANNAVTEKYCYSDTEGNCTTNGGLYQWDEAMQYTLTESAQGVCPSGWHIPSDTEQYTLEDFLKTSGQTCSATRGTGTAVYDCSASGTALKYGGSAGLNFTFGASAYSGWRTSAGAFANSGTNSYFWSSTQYDGTNSWDREFSSAATVGRGYTAKTYGLPVRCIADSNVNTSYSSSQTPTFTSASSTGTVTVSNKFMFFGGTFTQGTGLATFATFNQSGGTYTEFGNGSLTVTNTYTFSGGTYNGYTGGSGGTFTAAAFTYPVGSTATFNQGNGTVAINGAFTQNAGIFTGSSDNTKNMTVQTFSLSTGSFTAPAGTLAMSYQATNALGTIFSFTGGTFYANNGLIYFNSRCSSSGGFCGTDTVNVPNGINFNNVKVDMHSVVNNEVYLSLSGTATVNGTFTHNDGKINNGTWDVRGDVIIQNEAFGGTSTIRMMGGNNTKYTYEGGTAGILKIEKDSDLVTVTPNSGTTDLQVQLLFLAAGSFTAPSGTMTLASSVNGTFTVFNCTGGVFVHNSGTIRIPFSKTDANTIYWVSTTKPLTFFNLKTSSIGYDINYTYIISSGSFTIAGDFTQEAGAIRGSWNIEGKILIQSSALGGTAPLTLTGTNPQTITKQIGGTAPTGLVTINKPSGTVSLASAYTFGGGLSFPSSNASTFSQGTYGATITGTLTLAGGIYTQGTGTLTATAINITSGQFNGGSGTITITYSFSQSGGAFKNTSGTMNFPTVQDTYDAFSFSGGTFDHNNGTVSIYSSKTICSSSRAQVRISGTFSFYNFVASGDVMNGCGDGGIYASLSAVTVVNVFTHNSGAVDGWWSVKDVRVNSGAGGGWGSLWMGGSTNATYTQTSGGTGPNVTIQKPAGYSVSFGAGTTNVSLGAFSLISSDTPIAPPGNFTVQTFSQSGGTFTAPSGTMTVGYGAGGGSRTIFSYSGGSFSQLSGGTMVFTGNYYYTYCDPQVPGYVSLYSDISLTNVTVSMAACDGSNIGNIQTSGSGKLNVSGVLRQTNGVMLGAWYVQGNVVIESGADGGSATFTLTGTNNQTITRQSGGTAPTGLVTINKPSGTVSLASAYAFGGGLSFPSSNASTFSQGTYGATITGTLTLAGGTYTQGDTGTLSATTMTVSGGTYTTYYDSGDGLRHHTGAVTVTTLNISNGTFTQGTGTLTITNFSQSGGIFFGGASLNMSVPYFTLSGGTFNAPGGTLTIGLSSATASNQTIFTKSGTPTFSPGTGTVKFSSNGGTGAATVIHTLQVNTDITFNNLTLDMNTTNAAVMAFAGSGVVTVAGTLVHEDGTINGGTVYAQGNVVVAATEPSGGTTALTFSGTRDQTYTDLGGDEINGAITVNKSSGRVILLTNTDWNASGQGVTVTNGTVIVSGASNMGVANGARLTVEANGTFIMNGSGTLTVGSGSSSISVLNSGKVFLQSASECGGSDLIRIRSNVAGTRRTWSGTGSFSMRDLDVQDMATSGGTITLISSTLSNCDANWVNTGAANCPGYAVSVPRGTVKLEHGTVEVR